MTNPRDTGRYDAITDTWIDQQVQIDFAWGNIPMQPNDDRGEATLDPTLDSHIIATSGYEGFPAFITGEPYDDTVTNAIMPNIVGMTQVQAEAALAAAGFSSWNNNTTTSGANSGNDGKVASQYPGVGTVLNVTDQPQATYYDNPSAAVPNILGMPWPQANTTITNAGFTVGTVVTDVDTTNISIANTVASQNPTSGTSATVGSAIDYHLYNYVAPPTTGPIAGFNRTGPFSLNGNQSAMYVVGRTVKPTVGDTISVTGSSDASHNVSWIVETVVDDNTYNTGGTAVKVTLVSGTISSNTSSGGTWTKL